ncbi:hypothetical protein HY994_04300 [Candidatus Micrarchaeota archaeon]|nr:hypothetical protein [Candidatus Micrarchaeota archaeon]
MNRFLVFSFLFFAAFAALLAGYSGVSSSYQAELAVVGATQPLTATSSNYSLDVVAGTLSQGPSSGVLFVNPGFGFERSTIAHPQLASTAAPSDTTCCGPFTFTSTWTDIAGRGLTRVILLGNGTNYTASLSSGTIQNGTWSAIVPTINIGTVEYQWYATNFDGLLNSSSVLSFSTSPVVHTTGATPVPTVAPTTAPVVPESNSVPPIRSVTPIPVPEAQVETLGASSVVSGMFKETSSEFTVSYSAPSSGFNGEITYRMPLDFADYEAGLVKIVPEPKSVQPGSIIATWDVTLAPKETFVATVEIAKKLDSAILKEFNAPSLVSKTSAQPAKPLATAVPTQPSKSAPTPAGADNTVGYIVGALVLLGGAYYAFVGKGKSRPKGL